MLKDVVAVEPLPNSRLKVRFDDGTEGVVDVAKMVSFSGVFEPLKDEAFFAQVNCPTTQAR
jgi:hypothetical protein